MSKREVSEKEIDNRLEEIINTSDDKGFKNVIHVIRLLALILFNIRKDFVELNKIWDDFIEDQEEDSEPIAKPIAKKIKDDATTIFI